MSSEIEKQLENLERIVSDLMTELKGLSERVSVLEWEISWIDRSVNMRVRSCRWNKDGYCMYLHWNIKREEWVMREDLVNGKKVYRLNVRRHPLICVSCPFYEPKKD